MYYELSKTVESDMHWSSLCAIMSNKSSCARSVKRPNRYEDSNDMIVICNNENFIAEGTIDIFRYCTRCSAY